MSAESNPTNEIVGMIPARMDSTRFPGKPLAPICGSPMIEHVWRRASEALAKVFVVTDSHEIARVAHRFGAPVLLTSSRPDSGTLRCAEALRQLNAAMPLGVVNIQGDEPLIDPADIRRIATRIAMPQVQIATMARPYDPAEGSGPLLSPDNVKVVVDANGRALYFSRSPIPYSRGVPESLWPQAAPYLIHVGIYGYTSGTLRSIAAMSPGPLDSAEKLEQLRWLFNGLRIDVLQTSSHPVGVDTPQDLIMVESILSNR